MTDKDVKYKAFFTNDQAHHQLKDKSLNSGIWIMVGQFGGHSLRILSVIILARLLTPSDYGLIAMVAVLTNFIQMFKDIGLNVATVQSKEITHAQISNLFWYNTAISIGLGILVAIAAPFISLFYERPELFYITLSLATTFPISGLIIQHIALLQRQLKYKEIAIIQILSVVISIVAVVISALAGLRYWSLVIMQLTGVISTTVLALKYCPWIPSLPHKPTKTSHLLKFGGFLTASNFCEYLSNNLDKLLIGKLLNPATLGQYTKAFDLSLLPIRKISYPLNNLAIATLSRLHDDPERYRRYYTFAQETLVVILVPFLAIGFINSHELFSVLLGDQWLEAAPIFSWFCLLSIATAWTSSTRWLFLSQGRAKEFLYFTLLAAALSSASFIIGIHYGVMGITISYTLMTICIRTPLAIYFSSRKGAVSISDQAKCIIPTLLLTCIIVTLIYISQLILKLNSEILTIIVSLLIYSLCFIVAFLCNNGWHRRISKLAEIFFQKINLELPAIFK